MDGNGRWAESRGMPRLVGHKRGASRVKDIVSVSPALGVKTLTLYAFSTENWKRPVYEVKGLMKLFRGYLQNQLVDLHRNNVCVRFLGDPAPLSVEIRQQMDFLRDLTAENSGLNLNVAINYGGRDELLRAIRRIATKTAEGTLPPAEITEQTISEHLDTGARPDPDLIIRTAGELRLSNFMAWQSVYSELAFVNECWPDFTPEIYEKTLASYNTRTRQFGEVVERGA